MTVLLDDLIAETTVTTGTGTISLDGAQTGFKKFLDVHGDGDRVGYAIFTPGGDFERGIGRIIDGTPDTLTRDVVLVSSNGDTGLVDFAVGTKQVTGSFQTGVASQIAARGLAHAHRNGTDQTGISAASSPVKINYTTEDIDEQGWFDLTNDRYQPLLPGWYLINCALTILAGDDGQFVQNRIHMNAGSTLVGLGDSRQGSAGAVTCPLVSKLIFFNGTTDYVEHYISITGANLDIAGLASATHFTAWRVA